MSDENDGVTLPDGPITVTPMKRVSLAEAQFDPFKEYKTEPDKFYYRGINTRPHLLRKREAEGYQTIKKAVYGDLVLARIPKEHREEKEKYLAEKARNQRRAAVESFKEAAARNGIKTFEEK